MKRLVNIVRLQYANTKSMRWVPALILVGAFAISMLIFSLIPAADVYFSGGAQSPLWYFLAVGIQAMSLFFPFAMALGITRREFVLGNLAFGLTGGIAMGTMFAIGGLIEGATEGWGMNAYFFKLPWIWADGTFGAWLLVTVLTLFLFIIGFQTAAVYKRFGGFALTALLLLLALMMVGGLWIIGRANAWAQFFGWFNDLGPLSITLYLLGITVILSATSYLTLQKLEIR